jgi:hypothetical protein
MNRFSKRREKLALEEGRRPGRDGHPPYLEENELQEFELLLITQTLDNKRITIPDIAGMVFFIIY